MTAAGDKWAQWRSMGRDTVFLTPTCASIPQGISRMTGGRMPGSDDIVGLLEHPIPQPQRSQRYSAQPHLCLPSLIRSRTRVPPHSLPLRAQSPLPCWGILD